MNPKFKSVETKYREQREDLFCGLNNLDRRSFLKVSAAAVGAAAASGVVSCQSFQSVAVADETGTSQRNTPFRFAYISDSHLYEKKINDRFARALLRAVEDINRLDPQPDFV
ncbi:MAG: twin-arginine translocation signal domain-containing protein, partial [Planctomycetota bacterium]